MLNWDQTELPCSHRLHWPSQESPTAKATSTERGKCPKVPGDSPPEPHFLASGCFQVAFEVREVLLPQQNQLLCPARPPSAASSAEGKSHRIKGKPAIISQGHKPALVPVQMAVSPGHLQPFSRGPWAAAGPSPQLCPDPAVGPGQLSTAKSPRLPLKAGVKHQPGDICS